MKRLLEQLRESMLSEAIRRASQAQPPQISPWRSYEGFQFRIVGYHGEPQKVYAKGGKGKLQMSRSTSIPGSVQQGLKEHWFWNDGRGRKGSEDRRGSKNWPEAAHGLLMRYARSLATKGVRFKSGPVDDTDEPLDFDMF